MKTKISKNFSIGALLTLLLIIGGCSIDPNLNNNPNDINQTAIFTTQGQYALLITLQGVGIGDFYSNARSRVSSQWTFQLCAPSGAGARSQPVAYDNYQLTDDGPPDEMWKNAYYTIKTANDIINNADKVFGTKLTTSANTVVGMAECYKATILGEIAAFYGSAPIPINPVDPLAPPPYVDQKSVYAEVQRLFDDAITRFGNSAMIGQDLTFGGDGTKWIAVCHSLKARYYLQIKDYVNANSQASLGIATASGNLYALYDSTFTGGYSPWGHWSDVEGDTYRAEKHFIDSLKSEPGDNRLAKYFNKNDSGQYTGYADHNEVSTDSLESNPLEASTMKLYRGYGVPFPIITADETILIKAECEARGQGSGIGGAVADVNIIRSEAGLSAFASSDATQVLKQVLKQKWLQLFCEGQAYNDMRRTPEFPLWEKVPNKNLRFIYPLNEKTTNPNVPADNDNLVSLLLGI